MEASKDDMSQTSTTSLFSCSEEILLSIQQLSGDKIYTLISQSSKIIINLITLGKELNNAKQDLRD